MDADADRGVFGRVLRRFRLTANLSQEELAERAHLSSESISALERGRRRAPYRATLRLLAAGLGLSDQQREELEQSARRPRLADVPPTREMEDTDRASREPSHNLSRPISSFHGRKNELDDLARLLEEHRLVSIVGPGGIGKTRVAVELGWLLVDRYPDGVWFVDLAPLGADADVARSVLSALQITDIGSAFEAKALVHHLERRNALLIVDNCEHVIDQVARLGQTLLSACADLRFLITSREPLHLTGERVYRIPALASPPVSDGVTALQTLDFDAALLFVDRAKAANSAFAFNDEVAEITARLCRRLGGIALAIELAASRSAAFSPHQILTQLESGYGNFAGSSRVGLPRHQTMHATMRWSYDSLTALEQGLFRSVSIFAGGFTWEAARTLVRSAASADGVELDALTSLVDKSLIAADVGGAAPRYHLLDPIRSFGLEMVDATGERDSLRARFMQWCSDFARETHRSWEELSSADWSALVLPEVDNFRAALSWAIEDRHDVELGQVLIAASRRVWARWFPSEGRRWLDMAQAHVTAQTPRSVAFSLALADTQVHISLQEYRAALASAEQGEALRTADHDVVEVAELHLLQGLALAQLGQTSSGEHLIQSAVIELQAAGARQLYAYGLNALATARSMTGSPADSRELYEQALAVFRETGNERGTISVLSNLAEDEFWAGRHETAIRFCEEALGMSSPGREARLCLTNLAAYLAMAGRLSEARERARESLMYGGIARADVNIAFALQHLAAVATLRNAEDSIGEDVRRATRLLGFVDARVNSSDVKRETTEQREYGIVVDRLIPILGADEFARLKAQGGTWSEAEAFREALKI